VSDYGSHGSKQIDLLPGTLRGYRAFNTWGFFDDFVLQSMSSPYRWVPGIQSAVCDAGCVYAGGHPPLDVEAHTAPHSHCTCGFYAAYKTVPREYRNAAMYGVVKSSGRIILGDRRGFRAEKAEIEALCLSPHFPSTGRLELGYKLSDYYQVPIFATEDELMEHFPPDDVSALVGPLPDEDPESNWHGWRTHISSFTVAFQMSDQAFKAMTKVIQGSHSSFDAFMEWSLDDDTQQ
jgi:hypothetical protein